MITGGSRVGLPDWPRPLTLGTMPSIDDVRRLVGLEHGLATMATVRADGTVQCTVVNGGVVIDPRTGEPVVAFVARPGTRKLANLRERPNATMTWRAGWAWTTVEGEAELIGPDDPAKEIDDEGLGSCCGRSTPPREVESTRTGLSTTASWPSNAVSRCSCRRSASTSTPERSQPGR